MPTISQLGRCYMNRKVEMKFSVVSNATPLIALLSLNQLDLLNKLFDKTYITKQVYEEVVGIAQDRAGANELRKKMQEGKISIYDISDYRFVEMMLGRLHRGELSVMVAAKELEISFVLMDDASARKTAESFSLAPIGTVGILKMAKIKELIPEIKPLLDKLIENNFRISLKLYNDILKDVNEL